MILETAQTLRRWLETENPELKAAVSAAVPDAAKFRKALDLCAAKAQAAGSVDSAAALQQGQRWEAVLSQTADRVLQSSTATTSVQELDAMLDDIAAATRDGALIAAWSRIEQRTIGTVTARLVVSFDTMLAHLNAQLQDLMRQVRSLPSASHEEDDDELGLLCDKNARLRAAQAQIVFEQNPGAGQHVATYAYFRNYVDLYPAFFEAGSRQAGGVGSVTEGVPLPWPRDEAGRFRWTVAHPQAQVWIPTKTELEEAVAAGRVRAEQVRADRQGPEARRRLDHQAQAFEEATQRLDAIKITGRY